jgi:hypothetical protein
VVFAGIVLFRHALPVNDEIRCESTENFSLWTAVLGALLAGFVYSFFIGGFLGFRSWTLTPLIDFENERLLVYFLCFRLGVLFYRQGIFAEKPKGKLLCNIANGTAWVPVTAHIFIRLIPFFSAEGFSVTPAYRLMWWVSWLCFRLALDRWLFCYLAFSFQRGA